MCWLIRQSSWKGEFPVDERSAEGQGGQGQKRELFLFQGRIQSRRKGGGGNFLRRAIWLPTFGRESAIMILRC